MTDEERINEALLQVADTAGREGVVCLLLSVEQMSKPPLVMPGAALDKLVELELLRFEDRDDGRWYGLTPFGVKVRDAIPLEE